jgi:uncharacterized protein (DUF2237 family)
VAARAQAVSSRLVRTSATNPQESRDTFFFFSLCLTHHCTEPMSGIVRENFCQESGPSVGDLAVRAHATNGCLQETLTRRGRRQSRGRGRVARPVDCWPMQAGGSPEDATASAAAEAARRGVQTRVGGTGQSCWFGDGTRAIASATPAAGRGVGAASRRARASAVREERGIMNAAVPSYRERELQVPEGRGM